MCIFICISHYISLSIAFRSGLPQAYWQVYMYMCVWLYIYNIIYIYIHTYYIHIYIPYLYIYSYIIYPYIQYSIYIHFRRHQSVQKLVALQRFEFEYALSPFPMVTLAVAQIWPCWHKLGKGGSEYPESTHKWDWVKECEIPGVSLDLTGIQLICDVGWCGFATLNLQSLAPRPSTLTWLTLTHKYDLVWYPRRSCEKSILSSSIFTMWET